MEDVLVDGINYLYAALGGMVFMFVLDILCTSRAEQEQDKEDAKDGILRGKEAGRFVAMAEKNAREANARQDAEEASRAVERAKCWLSREGGYNYPAIFNEEPEELSPYQAGQAAYCLGKEAEDNPFRDDAYLGSEWEAGYYNSMKGDMGTWEY